MTDRQPDQTDIAFHMPYIQEVASHCRRVIEIGVGHGNGSTRAISAGLAHDGDLIKACHATHVMVDNRIAPSLEIPDHTFFLYGDSRDPAIVAMADQCLQHNFPELIFIDTHHTYEQLKAELEVWSVLAHPQWTKWLFHDTYMFGVENDMNAAIVEFCEDNPEWQWREITKESHGMWIMEGRE